MIKLRLLSIGAFATLCVSTQSVASIGDGPRAYMPTPIHRTSLSLYGVSLKGNSSFDVGNIYGEGNLNTDLAIFQPSYTHGLTEQISSIGLIVPYGKVSADVGVSGGFVDSQSSEGIGDVGIIFTLGLTGAPGLSYDEYTKFDPGLTIGFAGRFFMPTGDYDPNRAINLGSNQYSVQLAFPMQYYLADSYLDPELTTFEILPAVTFFTDNDDNLSGNLKQDPLYKLEGHITRNILPYLWLSADFVWDLGGETSIAGVSKDNSQNSFGLGATVGFALARSIQGNITYANEVKGNSNSAEGHFWRIRLNWIF